MTKTPTRKPDVWGTQFNSTQLKNPPTSIPVKNEGQGWPRKSRAALPFFISRD
jgi:hypothetical protein